MAHKVDTKLWSLLELIRMSPEMEPMQCEYQHKPCCLDNQAEQIILHRNKECDYSAAYIELTTSSDLKGQGMTFSELFFDTSPSV